MAKVVFSYSHADEQLRNELEKHLSPLKRMGKIETWHDRRIEPGDIFESEIDQNFSDADIVLLLVSPDFIASNYCYEVEMSNSLQRHERGEAIVIPVILRSCAWHQLPFGKLLAATTDGKPIIKFTHIDDGFVEVVEAVSKALSKVNSTSPVAASVAFQETLQINRVPGRVSVGGTSATGSKPSGLGPRSSNLAIRKEFTDRDRDVACRDGFDYLARFFENSSSELVSRNSELEADFRQRDADSFECSVYLNGKRVTHCGIWRSSQTHGMGDICYSNSGISDNSYNESMSVSDDGSVIGFKTLMGMMMGQDRDKLLTAEGMAEYFWESFLRPLK